MIADPVSLKRIHIACTVMLSFAACGTSTSRKGGLGPSDIADFFISKDAGQPIRVELVNSADSNAYSSGWTV